MGQREIFGIRNGVELVLQTLIEAEATEVIDAGHHERSDTRTNQRNGNGDRLAARPGTWRSSSPRCARGSFFPSLL